MPSTTAQKTVADSCNYLGGSSPCLGIRHGDDDAYNNHGCRCPAAREAHRVGRGRRQLRLLRSGPSLVDSTGTRRRLQALAAGGYSVEDIAAAIGSRPSYVGQLQHATRRVRRVTAAKVRAFYDAHADRLGPSPHAKHYAARNGWLGPAWWDDDTIDNPSYTPPVKERARSRDDIDDVRVLRAVDGEQVDLTRAERLEAVRLLHARDEPAWVIAERLHVSERQVSRDLAALCDETHLRDSA